MARSPSFGRFRGVWPPFRRSNAEIGVGVRQTPSRIRIADSGPIPCCGYILFVMLGRPDSGFIDAIVAAENRRNAAHRRMLSRRRDALRTEARRLVPLLLACDPGITRIRLFGSVLPGRRIRTESDLDLVIEGSTRFSECLRVVEESEWPVDLIAWEDLSELVRNVVDRDAEVLYGS